jgi:hypothetical protein
MGLSASNEELVESGLNDCLTKVSPMYDSPQHDMVSINFLSSLPFAVLITCSRAMISEIVILYFQEIFMSN